MRIKLEKVDVLMFDDLDPLSQSKHGNSPSCFEYPQQEWAVRG
jgi:hypothetical protein